MKTCDFCGADTLADDGDDYCEWFRARCSDPDCHGCMIECVACAQKRWDGDFWARKYTERPEALPREPDASPLIPEGPCGNPHPVDGSACTTCEAIAATDND